MTPLQPRDPDGPRRPAAPLRPASQRPAARLGGARGDHAGGDPGRDARGDARAGRDATGSPPKPAPAWVRVAVAAGVAAAMAAMLAWGGLAAPWAALVASAAATLLAVLRAAPVAAPPRQAPQPAPRPANEAVDAMLRDPHTGMFHRGAFLALAERDWQRAGRYGGALALLLVEVDRLRPMTERAGPAVADHLIGGLGRQVLRGLRGGDLLARFDAAQLAVLLPNADAPGALDVADRIRQQATQLELPGLPPGAPISASVGVALMQPLHRPLAMLVADAQRALQGARQAGGNCVRLAPEDSLPPIGAAGSWIDGDPVPPSRDA